MNVSCKSHLVTSCFKKLFTLLGTNGQLGYYSQNKLFYINLFRVWIKLLNFKDYVKGSKEHQLTADVELMKEQLLAEHRCTVFVSV